MSSAKETDVDVLVIGAGQAGLAVSAHLRDQNIAHLVVERSDRVADQWHSARWDSLMGNGPAGHDCFPVWDFPPEVGGPDAFASKDQVAAYFSEFAERIAAPVRVGVDIVRLTKEEEEEEDASGGGGGDGQPSGEVGPTQRGQHRGRFRAETAHGEIIAAQSVVIATGSFQVPVIPDIIPPSASSSPSTPPLVQLHSSAYKNPAQLPPGAVLVVGAGSSGAQIADELLRAGRRVYLSVGRHQRPPRRYRGRDNTWWLTKLGKWDAKPASADPAATKHVSIAVSGCGGGTTVDYREFARRGLVLLGRVQRCVVADADADGDENKAKLCFAPDLRASIEAGDRFYFALLREADDLAAREGLDLPADPDAHRQLPDPPCLTEPLLELDLAAAGVRCVVWATGYARDFGWVHVDGAVDATGCPVHQEGVSCVPGLYHVGLPFLRNRGSSFIFGVWKDAEYIAQRIAQDRARSEPLLAGQDAASGHDQQPT